MAIAVDADAVKLIFRIFVQLATEHTFSFLLQMRSPRITNCYLPISGNVIYKVRKTAQEDIKDAKNASRINFAEDLFNIRHI